MMKSHLQEIKECVATLDDLIFGKRPTKDSTSQEYVKDSEYQKPWVVFDEDIAACERIYKSSEDTRVRTTTGLLNPTFLKAVTNDSNLSSTGSASDVERLFCSHFEKIWNSLQNDSSTEPGPAKKIRLSQNAPFNSVHQPEANKYRNTMSENIKQTLNIRSHNPLHKEDVSPVKPLPQKLNYRHAGPGFNPPRSQVRSELLDNDSPEFLQAPVSHSLSGTAARNEERRVDIQKKRFPCPGQDYERDIYRNTDRVDRTKATKEDQSTRERESSNQQTFRTAHQQLVINDRAKGIKRNLNENNGSSVHVSGLRKPAKYDPARSVFGETESKQKEPEESENPELDALMEDPRMKNIDPKMVETILNEVYSIDTVDWNDIAGLSAVKSIIKEIIIWPMLRPDIFTGLRGPPKGILLFGPPGTGKTMIGRLIASQSKSSFFNISASSLTSKWIGDGEKMVRALFAVARVKQPAVIFIDEIDSILTQRSETEHESSRRLKTEFLIQFDGCGSNSDDRILVIGVTNRPQELDEAARRRLVKRIYIPLPDYEGRKMLVKNLLRKQHTAFSESDFDSVAEITAGFSGADMKTLCQEASYGPIRDVGVNIQNISVDQVRPIMLKDFQSAVKLVKASVDSSELTHYEEWDQKFGCHL